MAQRKKSIKGPSTKAVSPIRQKRRTSRLEPLESRWMRAGNVLAAVVQGNLVITEDPATPATDNQIQIDQIGVPFGTFNITGGGTTTVNGGAAATLPGVVKDINVDLDGGDDLVTVTTAVIGGNLKIEMGVGDNTVLITNTEVRRNLTVTGENNRDDLGILDSTIGANLLFKPFCGVNRMQIGDDLNPRTQSFAPVDIRGSLRMEGNCDIDDVSIVNTTVSKDVALHLGEGVNDVTISGITAFGGPLNISSGVFADKVVLGNSNGKATDTLLIGDVSLNLGDGDNDVLIKKMTMGSGLTITSKIGDDDVTISNTIIGGQAIMNLGAGDHEVLITTDPADPDGVTTTIRGALAIHTQGGDDTITITRSAILRNVSLGLGRGTNNSFLDPMKIGGTLNYAGGAEDDDIELFNTTILGHAVFALGAGDNDVTITSTSVQQNFTLVGGANDDDIFLETLSVKGLTIIQTLAGNDTIQINDSLFQNRFTLDSGKGDDTVLIENLAGTATVTTFVGRAKLDLGAGDDFLQIGVAADATRLARFENVTKEDILDGGKGFDDLDLNNATFAFPTSPIIKRFEA